MKKIIWILIFAVLLLSACAPKSAEVVTVENANPVVGAEAQAKNLEAISAFMDAAAARERANQPDYSWFWALFFAGVIFTFLACIFVAGVLLARESRKAQEQAASRIVNNNFLMLPPFGVSPRGRIFPVENDRLRLEASQNVTALAELAEHIQKQLVKR